MQKKIYSKNFRVSQEFKDELKLLADMLDDTESNVIRKAVAYYRKMLEHPHKIVVNSRKRGFKVSNLSESSMPSVLSSKK